MSAAPAQSSINAITALPLFKGIEPELLRGLTNSARTTKQTKGDIFLHQNQPFTRFYIVLDGWCAISKGNQDGQESILQILSYGDFLPEPELSQKDLSPFNVQALTPVTLLMIPPTFLHNALQQSPTLMKNMLTAAAARMQDLRDHIEQLTLRSAEERVGRFLLQVRPQSPANGCEIELPFDKNFIASYLGIKPETLSRTLQLFKERGFEINRSHVTVPNFHSLCSFCDSTLANKCQHAHTDECPNPSYNEAHTT